MKDMSQSEPDSAASVGEPARDGRSPGCVLYRKTFRLPRPVGLSRGKLPASMDGRKGQREETPWLNDEVVEDGTVGSVGERSRENRPEQTGATRWTEVRASVRAQKRGNARGAKGRREMEA